MAEAHSATIDATFTEHASTEKAETRAHRCGGMAKKKWSLAELGTMVGGFVLFWPVGLAALGLKLVKGEMWPGSSENVAPWKASWKRPESFSGEAFKGQWKSHSWNTSGNAAFDAYKRSKLDELEAARKKLEEEQKAFGEYLKKLREAKDRDEFDRFMAEQNAPKSG